MSKKYFQWTKERIKTIVTLWETKTKQEIADELGCEVPQVDYIASVIRKFGYKLPKKSQRNILQKLVQEVLSELNK